MPTKKMNPTSPGMRGKSKIDNADLTTKKPYKPLTKKLRYDAGRNNTGRITCRHKGNRVPRQYRIIDFKRNKFDIPAKVVSIEYDPYRNVRISLVMYADGERRYILHPEGLNIGDTILSAKEAPIKPGNCLPLSAFPLGSVVHNIELIPGKGGQMVRSAGTSAQVLAKENGYVTLKLPSGEMRMVLERCVATMGVLDNAEQKNIKLGKAGIKRHMGIRPTVRGSVMNPVDHPHGGGEGRAPIGRDAPRTPWGKKAMGVKTRSRKKSSNRLIVRNRKGRAISKTASM